MPEPDLTAEPWCQLPPRAARALIRAGYDTADKCRNIPGRELRATKGIGNAYYKAIREVFPDPSGGGMRVGATGTANLQTGNPGNAGGGRPTSRVREAATLAFEDRIDRLGEIADGVYRRKKEGEEELEDVAVDQSLRAIDLLGKYGPGTRREVEHVLDFEGTRELLEELAEPIKDYVHDEEVRKLIAGRWRNTIRQFFHGVV